MLIRTQFFLSILSILIGPASFSVAQPPEFPEPYFPKPETLDSESLERLLSEWDAALQKDDLSQRARVLRHANTHVPEGMRFSGSRVVKFDNREIFRRLIDQYFSEYAKQEEEPDDAGPSTSNPWHAGEGGAAYLRTLTTMAESTMSPQIYETVLMEARYMGDLRELYLARINPEATLNVLFDSTFGTRPGRRAGPDTFYTAGDGRAIFNVSSVFRFLSLCGEISPEALLQQRTRVQNFVATYAKHFTGLREVPYRDEPTYSRWLDYPVRMDALGVLEVIAAPGDGDLVRSLVEDLPPPLPDDARRKAEDTKVREDLHAKAKAILARLAG